MAEPAPIAQSTDASASNYMRQRIATLGGTVAVLRAAGQHDMAREIELTRDRLIRELAAVGESFAAEPTLDDAVGLLVVIRDALTMPAPSKRGESAYRAVLAERVEWTRNVLEAVLMGRHDMAFAASFLAAQVARLQPDSAARQERHAAG
jgi:hypothetical protein